MSEYTVEQAISMALQHIRICAPDPVVDAALEAALLERRAQWPSEADLDAAREAYDDAYTAEVLSSGVGSDNHSDALRAALQAVAPAPAQVECPICGGADWSDLGVQCVRCAALREQQASAVCAVCDGPNTYDRESGVCAICQDVVEPPAQASAVPYGWKWVSREPTNEMCSAPDSVWNPEARVIWQQMFDAAPQPPKVKPIDLQAVREVIDELLSQPFIDRSHEWRAEIANKLSRAIGDTP